MGADSTTTYGDRHYNNSQKLFEVGRDSTIGAITWGLGGLIVRSYRTMFAELDDDLKAHPPADLHDVANRWCARFWAAYNDANSPIAPHIATSRALAARPAYDPAAAPPPADMRSAAEEAELTSLRNTFFAGFCIAGYVLPSRIRKCSKSWSSLR